MPATAADAPVWLASASDGLASSSVYQALIVADGPQAYWPLTDSAGPAQEVIGGLNATYAGLVTPRMPGIPGDRWSTQFDKNNGGATSTSTSTGGVGDYSGTAPFSIEGWVYMTATPTTGQFPRMIERENYSPSRSGWVIYAIANSTRIGFDRWASGSSSSLQATNGCSLNAWHHVVGVYDGTNMNLYVDGVTAHAQLASALSIPAQASALAISCDVGRDGGSFWQGQLAHVAIYNYALSATQIAKHYAVGASALGANVVALDAVAAKPSYATIIKADAPLAYWRLAEASGTLFEDQMKTQNANLGSGSVGAYGVASALAQDPADRSLTFDGSTTKINVPFNAALYPGQQFTIEGWFNGPIQTTNCPMNDCRPASSGANAAGWDLFFGLVNGGNVTIGLSVCSANVSQTIIQSTVTPNAWHHCVGTYDGVAARLYIDGVLKAGPTVCPYTKNPSAVAGIGHLASVGGANVLNGSLDEIAVYGYALSPQQIANHYAAGIAALGAQATAKDQAA